MQLFNYPPYVCVCVCVCVCAVECSADEVLCSSRVECVLSTLTCDLTADCSDGSDEDCTTCTPSHYPHITLTLPTHYPHITHHITPSCVLFTDAASIIRAPEDTMVIAYNTTSFSCQSFGEGATIMWSFNGRPVMSSDVLLLEESYDSESSITTSYLTVDSPSLEEAGVYVCTVSNAVSVTSPRTRQAANASLVVLPSEYTHECWIEVPIKHI